MKSARSKVRLAIPSNLPIFHREEEAKRINTKEDRKNLVRVKLKKIETEYHEEVMDRVNKTVVYSVNSFLPVEEQVAEAIGYSLAAIPHEVQYKELENNVDCPLLKTEFIVEEGDSVGAVMQYREAYPSKRIMVMNFASYQNPGGGFLNGMIAQEEALCHGSYLFSILARCEEYYRYNKNHKNKGLYESRCLYTPDVRFFDAGKEALVDVITISSPNRSIFKYNAKAFSKEENTEALQGRIKLLKNVCKEKKIDILIAGAFGCGVFHQDPEEVASIFYDIFKESTVKKIYFPIPQSYNLRKMGPFFRAKMRENKGSC